MSRLINHFDFADMSVDYILNDYERAVLIILPKATLCDFFSEKNIGVYNKSSLVHLQLSKHNTGMFSNTFKLGDSLSLLKYKNQFVDKKSDRVTIITEEESDEGYGIRHNLCYHIGEKGFEVWVEFYNNSNSTLEIEYITSASLDALSPLLDNEGSRELVFHRFKAGWSMEGLHRENTLSELGLERTWTTSAECIKIGAIGTRAVREYHPYSAIEDKANNCIWGIYLAHNASWQMELSRVEDGVSLSAGLADITNGLWSKKVNSGDTFVTPTAMISTTIGGISELSNRILDMRHRLIDQNGEDGLPISYNDYVATWGKPTESQMLDVANILKKGKTKYLVMDAGWFVRPNAGVGDWIVNMESFPNGLKSYAQKVRELGMVPGLWMEFERTAPTSKAFGPNMADLKLKWKDRVIVGTVINGGKGDFFDFRNPKAVEYLKKHVIDFLRDNDFGYLKVDYNSSAGIGVDGNESPGENLRQHMKAVRDFFIEIKKEIPDIVIENCAGGGCRLEPSMMDITAISSASDTHEVYEAAIVAANLHYLTPPRQNLIWCTLKPEYSKERFSYVISQGFLGRICWSGFICQLNNEQLSQIFKAEEYYESVSDIIKKGNSYIYRTNPCSFQYRIGTQAVLRYSEDEEKALLVVHSFKDSAMLQIKLNGKYGVASSLYENDIEIKDHMVYIKLPTDYSGNVYLLKKDY